MYNVDGSQQETKRTTAIASGNYPDIMAVSGSDLIKYAQTGVIADITEVYENMLLISLGNIRHGETEIR